MIFSHLIAIEIAMLTSIAAVKIIITPITGKKTTTIITIKIAMMKITIIIKIITISPIMLIIMIIKTF